LTAVLLSQKDVPLRIIDEKPGIESCSDACLLHSRSLSLLNALGLSAQMLDIGRRVDTVLFYEGLLPRAQLKIADLSSDFPYLETVFKRDLETLLEARLNQAGIQVDSNHRLAGLESGDGHALAAIESLIISAKGYVIPEMDWEIEKTEQMMARYVVGADGDDSKVAQLAGIEYETAGTPEFYLICELESDWPVENAVYVILQSDSTSTLWPLPGKAFRWSFQLTEEEFSQSPFKERSSIQIQQPAIDQANKGFVESLVHQRAPWFTGSIGQIHWSTGAQFSRRLAARLGHGRYWLLGDAAHGTLPAGMQSLNAGLAEAEQFAEVLLRILAGTASVDALEAYIRDCREEWERLLSFTEAIEPQAQATPWVREQPARILSCLPATGPELRLAAQQLGLEFVSPDALVHSGLRPEVCH